MQQAGAAVLGRQGFGGRAASGTEGVRPWRQAQDLAAERDRRAEQIGAQLVVGHVEDSIKRGTVRLRRETDSRNAAQAVTLLETIEEHGFTAMIGGARRDEEKARAKERIFSFREGAGQWDPKNQRPELWSLFNGRIGPGESIRVFPLSN